MRSAHHARVEPCPVEPSPCFRLPERRIQASRWRIPTTVWAIARPAVRGDRTHGRAATPGVSPPDPREGRVHGGGADGNRTHDFLLANLVERAFPVCRRRSGGPSWGSADVGRRPWSTRVDVKCGCQRPGLIRRVATSLRICGRRFRRTGPSRSPTVREVSGGAPEVRALLPGIDRGEPINFALGFSPSGHDGHDGEGLRRLGCPSVVPNHSVEHDLPVHGDRRVQPNRSQTSTHRPALARIVPGRGTP
jgi:hypothetical protein